MAETLRIGILGLTHDHIWGELPHLREGLGAELMAAADPHEALLKKVGDEYGCAVYDDGEEMLEKEKLDAVYVFADNAGSVELVERAAGRGLHVMVEKPMAANLAGAEQMLSAAREAGVRLMINWPFAWWPQLQHALEVARSGEIGELWEVKYRAAHAGPRAMGCSEYFCEWLYDEGRNGGGAFADYTCYGALLARVLLGRPRQVTGFAGRLRTTDVAVDDNGVIVMSYEHAVAISEGSWTQIDDMTNYRPVIYGTRGTLTMEPRAGGKLWLATKQRPDGQLIEVPDPAAEMRSATAHFVAAIGGGTICDLCDATMGRDAQEIMEAGLISWREGRRVDLPLGR